MLAGSWEHYAMAAINTMQGNLEAAIDILETSVIDGRRYGWWILEKDNLFEPLWPEPRFQALVDELRLI